MKRFTAALLVFCLAGWSAWAAGTMRVTVHTADGRTLPFTVELAKSNEELTRGLMNRPSLAVDSGMIFDFSGERPVTMWMKDTLIPLDMVFIAGDGRILGIAQRTVPQSLETIASPGPVRFVLELNGGTTDRLAIHAGDRIGAVVEGPAQGAKP